MAGRFRELRPEAFADTFTWNKSGSLDSHTSGLVGGTGGQGADRAWGDLDPEAEVVRHIPRRRTWGRSGLLVRLNLTLRFPQARR